MTDLTTNPAPLEGPDWAPHDLLDVRGGLFPLSVETHFIATIAKLLPGATTVTTLARYYTLHAYLALVTQERELPWGQAVDLLRRCEVVVAGAAIAAGIGPTDERPHAYDVIKPRMDEEGYLDVAALAGGSGGYSDQRNGFLPAYLGSENETGLVTGNGLVPGPRVEASVLRAGFDGLLDLAAQDRLTPAQLQSAEHLSINATKNGSDGPWLARLLCGVGLSDPTPGDRVRNDTARLVARSLLVHPSSSVLESFRALVTYGPDLASDAVASQIPAAHAWRGCLLRHESVGAWRIVWAWTVDQITGQTDPAEIAAAMTAEFPPGTLEEFLAGLPPTVDMHGHPTAAEEAVRQRGWSKPTTAIAILALGAMRYDELEGHARDAFAEPRPTVLSPPWVRNWVNERRSQDMAQVAADLVEALLDRAKRVAFRKMRIRPDGTIWLPTRVHEENGLLYRIGRGESSRNVGIRLEQYARILTALDVLANTPEGPTVTDLGRELLEVEA